MPDTYCGKNCDDCLYRRELSCFGCKISGREDCPIARCCVGGRRENCQSCPTSGRCGTLQQAEQIPKKKTLQISQARQLREEQHSQGIRLRKFIRILLILSVPEGIGAMLCAGPVRHLLPGISGYAALLMPLLWLGVGMVYGIMGGKYRLAGGCFLAAALVRILQGEAGFLPYAASLLAVLAGEYVAAQGHGETLEPWDPDLGVQWPELWKWRVLIYLQMLGTALLSQVVMLSNMFYILAYSVYLAVMALAYVLRLSQIHEEERDGTPKTVVIFSRKMPIRLVNMDYLGATLIVILILALGLLNAATALIQAVTTALTVLYLYRTLRVLPAEPKP